MYIKFKEDGHRLELQKGQRSWDLEVYRDDKLVLFDDFPIKGNEGILQAMSKATDILNLARN